HPNGQLPAYEWGFGDVNPPVHAWAALRVFAIDGSRDTDFLARIFHKLLLNFTWWVNRKETLDDNVFTGGFLGLDNIGPFDRSAAPGRRRRAAPDALHGWSRSAVRGARGSPCALGAAARISHAGGVVRRAPPAPTIRGTRCRPGDRRGHRPRDAGRRRAAPAP